MGNRGVGDIAGRRDNNFIARSGEGAQCQIQRFTAAYSDDHFVCSIILEPKPLLQITGNFLPQLRQPGIWGIHCFSALKRPDAGGSHMLRCSEIRFSHTKRYNIVVTGSKIKKSPDARRRNLPHTRGNPFLPLHALE
ncbi:hypothetical protein D3C75_800150 [compost metagenome]